MNDTLWDVTVVGGGPAGLNAALVLGRYRRKVLLFDDGKPRNAVSHALRGFLSRDGTNPGELLALGREQLVPYPSVLIDHTRVVDAPRTEAGFIVHTSDGRAFRTRSGSWRAAWSTPCPSRLGSGNSYGIGSFHCPYCDGWKMRDQPLAVYGRGDDKGGGLALEMTLWSDDIVLCTDGPADLSDHYRKRRPR